MNTHRFGHWIPEYIYSRVEWLQIFETLLYSSRVVDRIPLPWWSRLGLASIYDLNMWCIQYFYIWVCRLICANEMNYAMPSRNKYNFNNSSQYAELYFLIITSSLIIVLVFDHYNSDLLYFSCCLRSTKEVEVEVKWIIKKKDRYCFSIIIIITTGTTS